MKEDAAKLAAVIAQFDQIRSGVRDGVMAMGTDGAKTIALYIDMIKRDPATELGVLVRQLEAGEENAAAALGLILDAALAYVGDCVIAEAEKRHAEGA